MLNFGNKEFRNLQEQVLKNAQDIETLKGRENLQVIIVNELPEVGNPSYIYLVAKDDGESPDVYDEYIWLEDEERYEKIGGVSIDLTNYVTLNSEQTITAPKTLTTTNYVEYNTKQVFYLDSEHTQYVAAISTPGSYVIRIARYSGNGATLQGGIDIGMDFILPTKNNGMDLGSTSYAWKNLYLSGNIHHTSYYFSWDNGIIFKTSSNTTLFYIGNNGSIWFYGTLIPSGTSGTRDVGDTTHFWRDLYITGSLKDGANTVTVANISSKATSTFISGTFDANGESTIDTEQAGTPEGLFIFTYGNCQCFLRLTATMVQNADVTPIRVACPMIYNSDTVNGWLNITKSGYILILTITDGTNHVDSGYAWTLTKTNLL